MHPTLFHGHNRRAEQSGLPLLLFGSDRGPYRGDDQDSAFHDLESIEILSQKYLPSILNFTLSTTRDVVLAKAIAEACLLQAHHARPSFPPVATVKLWLIGIAINLVRGHPQTASATPRKRPGARSVNIPHSLSLAAQNLNPDNSSASCQPAERVWEILGTLSLDQRLAFVLKFMNEMTVAQIAEAMNLSVATTKDHLHRAVRVMRSGLERL